MMKKKIITFLNCLKTFIKLLAILLISSISTQAFEIPKYLLNPKSFYSVGSLVNRYRKKDLVTKLKKFVSDNRPSRLVGSKGHEHTISWLMEELKTDREGISVKIESFLPDYDLAKKKYLEDFETNIASKYKNTDKEYLKWKKFTDSMISYLNELKGRKGNNIIWEKKGNKPNSEILVLGAHYDSISFPKASSVLNIKAPMPGADDNASGVAALLGLIEILEKLDLKKTVRILFFDMQEIGMLGSKAYLEKNHKELIEKKAKYINVEMIGHDTKKNDLEKKYRNFKVYIRGKNDKGYSLDKGLADYFVNSGKKTRSSLLVKIVPNSFEGSDHFHFWKKGIPALAFTQNRESDFNKRQHSPDDFPETLNTRTYYQAFSYLSGSVISWAFDITL